ncbi:hypothetical protein Tco_1523595, partial [Tanacetum coccineum]
VPDVTKEESSESEAGSSGNDEDDGKNEQDSSGEDSDQVNDNDDDKTQSHNENESDSEHETNENESGSEFDQEKNEEDIGDDEEEVKDEFVKTPSNDSDDEDEIKITDKAEVDTDKGFIQEEGTDTEMTNVQQGNENPEISQVIEDAYVTLSTVPQKTEVPVISSSHSSDLASKFLNFSDIPHTYAEFVSPMDVHVHHEVPSQQTLILTTVHVSVIIDSSPEVSNFAPPEIQRMVTESLEQAFLAKLKKILIDKMDKSESYLATPEHRECYEGLIKSYDLDKTIFSTYEEPEFGVADSDMPQDQEGNLGNDDEPMKETVSKRQTQSWLMTLASSVDKLSKTFDELMSTPIDFSAYIMNRLKITNLTQETLLGPAFRLLKCTCSNYAKLEYDFEECYKPLSEKLDWENPKGGDYPFDLTKPLPLVMSGNRQKVPVDYFFNNDLKYLQGGVSTMTYTTSITKTKAAQYDLPGIEDMVPNIWVPVKVAYDKHAYGYLKEIIVRRVDNNLYRFKEGDFPRLRINDIEDMLLLVVHNRLTDLSGDDVFDITIALRMFTRSLVIQKRVKDLQLGVESYQKKINITKPKTTKSGIRKRDPYTPYQDPQGFIYVDNNGRNRLMR